MAQFQRITQFSNKFSDNILSPKSALIDSPFNVTSGGANVSYFQDPYYGNFANIGTTTYKTTDISFNFGDSLTTPITRDGNYLFQFSIVDFDPNPEFFVAFNFAVQVFKNGALDETITGNMVDNVTLNSTKTITFAQNIVCNSVDTIDFAFTIFADTTYPFNITTFSIGNFKLEHDNKFLGLPTPYSYPLKDIDYDVANLVYVEDISKFPTPISGVITLEDKFTYIITKDLDLNGNRLVTNDAIVNLYGFSSETSVLTSSGLGAGIPLITSNTTIKLRDLTIKDVDTALSLNKETIMALDWEGVNFVNVPNVGVLNNFDNLIFTKGTFLNCRGLVLDGTFGTAGFSDSLFQGDGIAGSIISLPDTANVTRRFRLDKCAVVAFGSTTAINVNASATIPSERYILDTVAFSGGGTYLSGVDNTSNKALFRFNDGITNTSENSMYYMENNATVSDIVTAGAYIKIAGTTISGMNSRFTNTNNRATYTGSKTRTFEVGAIATILSASDGDNIAIRIHKNGTAIAGSRSVGVTRTDIGVAKADNLKAQTIVELATNDFIEIFVANLTDTSDVTVVDLSVILK